jgi:hypothetical protein
LRGRGVHVAGQAAASARGRARVECPSGCRLKPRRSAGTDAGPPRLRESPDGRGSVGRAVRRQ